LPQSAVDFLQSAVDFPQSAVGLPLSYKISDSDYPGLSGVLLLDNKKKFFCLNIAVAWM